jgi:predicted MPP superfamily phosphohydrolase
MLVWGFTGGQSRIQHSEVRVPLEGLHEDHDGLRIVQLSDLHIGNGMEGARLEALVMRTNALSPDVIALTGDIFDFDPSHIESGARGLSGLRARLGVYAVLGNHDTYTGIEQVVAGLERFAPQLQLLRKDLIRLPGEAPLYLAGIDDPGNVWTARGFHLPALDELAAQMPSDGPVLLLVHRPEAFPQASELGFALVLAGHTHGGQIAVPFAPRTLNPARIITSYPRGLYRENGSLLYVNRGVGVAGPALRISCTREIATIRLISRD